MDLKDKIMNAAYELFGEKGYDKTSVAEIIKKAGASKGGFYHHFKSKEDILEAITFGYVDMIKSHYDDILQSKELSVIEKFVASYSEVNNVKIEAVKDWDKIRNLYTFKDNHILLRKMGEAFERETANFYLTMIKEGVEQGVFRVEFPEELADLWGREAIKFQQMSRYVLMGERVPEEKFYNMLKFNETLINQQLGLEERTIELVPMGEQYLEDMRRELKGRVM